MPLNILIEGDVVVLSNFNRLMNDPRYVDAGLVTLPGEFSLPGYAPAKSWGTLEAGIEARFARGWTAFAGYQGRFADDSQSLDTANVGVRLAF